MSKDKIIPTIEDYDNHGESEENETSVILEIQITKTLYDDLGEIADCEGQSINELIVDMLEQAV